MGEHCIPNTGPKLVGDAVMILLYCFVTVSVFSGNFAVEVAETVCTFARGSGFGMITVFVVLDELLLLSREPIEVFATIWLFLRSFLN